MLPHFYSLTSFFFLRCIFTLQRCCFCCCLHQQATGHCIKSATIQMTNRGSGRSQAGGVACGLATAKMHAKIVEQRVQKSKNETKRGKKRNINRKQAGKWAWAGEREGKAYGGWGGACLAWRPRVQRGVGQVQRRLKSLIIASNALAQRAPRRATKKIK